MIDQILEVTTFKCYPETSWMKGIKENVAKILKINDQKQKKTRINCIKIDQCVYFNKNMVSFRKKTEEKNYL